LCPRCRIVLVDATGTTRRLQALARAGYPSRYIAAELSLSHDLRVRRWRSGRYHQVWRSSEVLVKYLYDRLWDTDGPSAAVSRWASQQGWEPFEAWTEETIDDPLAKAWAELDRADYVDHILLSRVRMGKATFSELNLAEQTVLFQEHYRGGGAVRSFRDRHRPVPIDTLREIIRRLGLEIVV
jgi:Zn-finger nucleic acid-binding protein